MYMYIGHNMYMYIAYNAKRRCSFNKVITSFMTTVFLRGIDPES